MILKPSSEIGVIFVDCFSGKFVLKRGPESIHPLIGYEFTDYDPTGWNVFQNIRKSFY